MPFKIIQERFSKSFENKFKQFLSIGLEKREAVYLVLIFSEQISIFSQIFNIFVSCFQGYCLIIISEFLDNSLNLNLVALRRTAIYNDTS